MKDQQALIKVQDIEQTYKQSTQLEEASQITLVSPGGFISDNITTKAIAFYSFII
jgi:hypothetical protein